MTRISYPAAKRLVVSLGFLLAGATAASAQVPCPQAISPGPPIVQSQHIFCGQINPAGAGRATGFHSRPGGANPNSVGNTINLAVPAGEPAGIYTISNFNITENGVMRVKALSTMFPDACNQANVLAAICNALAVGVVAGRQFDGPSGATCQAGLPLAPLNIRGFTNAAGDIVTGYPNY